MQNANGYTDRAYVMLSWIVYHETASSVYALKSIYQSMRKNIWVICWPDFVLSGSCSEKVGIVQRAKEFICKLTSSWSRVSIVGGVSCVRCQATLICGIASREGQSVACSVACSVGKGWDSVVCCHHYSMLNLWYMKRFIIQNIGLLSVGKYM